MSLVVEQVAQPQRAGMLLEQQVVLPPQVGLPQREEQVGVLLEQLVVLLPQVGTLLVQLEEQAGVLLEPRVQ